MKITNRLFWQIRELSKKIKTEFFKKGVVIPSKTVEGDVRVGQYLIRRQRNDFYSVLGTDGETLAENINLPQTAIIVANTLALKNYVDRIIVEKDREYGYAYFEHQLYKRAEEKVKKDPGYYDVNLSKFETSGERAEDLKIEILRHYEKLKKIA